MSSTAPETTVPEQQQAPAAGEQQPNPGQQPAAAPGTGTEQPPAAPQQSADPWADPAAARAEIERLRRENAAARTNAKQTAADEAKQQYATEIGKILGLVKDDTAPDPQALAQQLTTAQAQARQRELELAIYKRAGTAKADPNALLDSRTFLEKATGLDPTDTAALDAAISEAISTNPRFKATQAAAVGGADIGAGGQQPTRTYTRAQLADTAFYQANRTDILAAQREGRIKD